MASARRAVLVVVVAAAGLSCSSRAPDPGASGVLYEGGTHPGHAEAASASPATGEAERGLAVPSVPGAIERFSLDVRGPVLPRSVPTLPDDAFPPPKPGGPWPVEDVAVYGSGQGLPGRVTAVGVDDAQNVYATDGSTIYAMPAGASGFTATSGIGQLPLGYPAYSLCGGAAGRVYVGYLAPELGPPEVLTEPDKLWGDLDRFALQPDGTLALEFHHRLQNSNSLWMDHTRDILSCARVVGGPNHGDLYLGSNHGVDVLRGDSYADHRHAVFETSGGSLGVGYVWDVNTDSAGNLLLASYWKLAALPPAPLDDVQGWLNGVTTPWLVNTYAENLGAEEDPDDLRAIAGDVAQNRIWVGSKTKGLSRMQILRPRIWTGVAGTPDPSITALELDGDGRLWVGTEYSGLWRHDDGTGNWEQSPYVPSGAHVFRLHLDQTVSPRALYVATSHGLYVIRAR